MKNKIQEILENGSLSEKKGLFSFTTTEADDIIKVKYRLWSRYFFYKYFTSPDAEFHDQIDNLNIEIYKGISKSFTNIAFRGAAKTARTKLFIAFVIANDLDNYRRYIKVLSHEQSNGTQIVTDIYNMLVNPAIKEMYPEIFEKTNTKREETMSSFTTSTGVKVLAATVGKSQRGALQDSSRPDFLWFEDFENRITLRSARKTMSIWDNMEEARTGLSIDGVCLYTCNYISEQGNVHKLVTREDEQNKVLIVPIIENGVIAWSRYTLADIEEMKRLDDDFEGERLCKPSANKDILFDRETLEEMKVAEPIRDIAGFKIYKNYEAGHRYAGGHDISGGVGLDSSASVFIDFSVVPAQVVATFASNTIKPEAFGDEIYNECNFYGNCLTAPENKYGTETILRLKQLNANIYRKEKIDTKIQKGTRTEYGWDTNALTKPLMLNQLAKAIRDGLLILNDKILINECKGYTRNDLMDGEHDPRETTRHFDLLMACAIAWQMKDEIKEPVKFDYSLVEAQDTYSDIGL